MLTWTLRKLKSADAATRLRAAVKLGEAGDGRAVVPLVEALKQDAEYGVRVAAANALAAIGGRDAQAAIGAKLRDGDADRDVVAAVAHATLKGGGADAKPAIAAALQDARPVVRRGVALALTWAKDALFSDLAERAMDDADPEVRRWACSAVMNAASGRDGVALVHLMSATMRNPDIPESVFEHEHIRPRVREILGRIPEDWWKTTVARAAVPTLIERLRDRSYAARVGVLEALGRIGDPSARDALLKFLFRGDLGGNEFSLAGGFAAAKQALDAVDPAWRTSEAGRRGIAGWIARLVDDDPDERCDGVFGLHDIDPNWKRSDEALNAVPLLRMRLNYRDKHVRENAAFYLMEMGVSLNEGEEAAPGAHAHPARETLSRKEGEAESSAAFKTAAAEAWTSFAAGLSLDDLKGESLPPQICLYVKTSSMAEALAGSRPAGASALLAAPPEIITFKDGTAAVRFLVRAGREIKPLVAALFSGVDYPEPVVVTNGALVDVPAEDRSIVTATFGAREGLGFGKVIMW